jgi:Cytidylate kinase
MAPSNSLVITISRQLGAGGANVGQQLANKLNIFFADREIICMAAKQLSTMEDNLELREEKMLSFWRSFFKGAPHNDVITVPSIAPALEFTDQELFDVEAGIIKKIAEERPAVVLGRCGFDVLRKYPNHVSIFLHANKDIRIERIQELQNLSNEAATRTVEKSDKERAAYCKSFTGKEWMNAQNYNLSIDTGKLTSEEVVELIMNYLKLLPDSGVI